MRKFLFIWVCHDLLLNSSIYLLSIHRSFPVFFEHLFKPKSLCICMSKSLCEWASSFLVGKQQRIELSLDIRMHSTINHSRDNRKISHEKLKLFVIIQNSNKLNWRDISFNKWLGLQEWIWSPGSMWKSQVWWPFVIPSLEQQIRAAWDSLARQPIMIRVLNKIRDPVSWNK